MKFPFANHVYSARTCHRIDPHPKVTSQQYSVHRPFLADAFLDKSQNWMKGKSTGDPCISRKTFTIDFPITDFLINQPSEKKKSQFPLPNLESPVFR